VESFSLGAALQQHEESEKSEFLSFPKIMGGIAGAFAQIYAASLEVPEHFLYISFLTCLGNVIAERVTLNTEISPQPRLYVLLLGESADDRKSTALNKTISFFKEALSDFNVCWGIGSAEGLQKRIEDSTRLLLCFDEFRQFVSKCKIDGSVLLPCVNTLFESNRYESRTKTYDISLDCAYLSLLAASTLQTYERTWDSSFTDIGFNNRLFLVPGQGEKRFSLPVKIAESDKTIIKNALGDILRYLGNGIELTLTSDARNLYHEWYMNLERSIHAKRLDTYALRFMILLAVNEGRLEVDSAIVSKVTELMDWQLRVRQIHDPIDAEGKMAIIEQKIRRILFSGPKSERDIKRQCHAERVGLWFFTSALNNMSRAREIQFDKNAKTWRIS
jgi:hypothetical protein